MTWSALNAIVDAEAAGRAGLTLGEAASACLEGGARFLQIRAKDVPGGRFLREASAIIAEADRVGATVIINDRADVARLARAGGVHVGQDDLDPAFVRRIVGAPAMVGYSTHTIEQVEAALEAPVDYIAVGPVYGTATKATGYEAVGLALVREGARRAHARGLKLVAIGGITLDRASDVLGAGADAVAVIGDLLATGDPAGRVRAYLSLSRRS